MLESAVFFPWGIKFAASYASLRSCRNNIENTPDASQKQGTFLDVTVLGRYKIHLRSEENAVLPWSTGMSCWSNSA